MRACLGSVVVIIRFRSNGLIAASPTLFRDSRLCGPGDAAESRIRCAIYRVRAPRVVPLYFGHRPVRRLRYSINIATFAGSQRPHGELN